MAVAKKGQATHCVVRLASRIFEDYSEAGLGFAFSFLNLRKRVPIL